MRLILTLLLAMFLLSTLPSQSIQAQEVVTVAKFPLIGVCLDSSTLLKYTNFTVNSQPVVINQTKIPCSFGCVVNATQYGDDCRDHSILNNLIAVLAMIGISALLVFLASRMGFPEMVMLYLMMTLLIMVGVSWVAADATAINSPGISGILTIVYQILIIIFVLLLCMIFFRFLVNLLMGVMGRR